MKLVDLEAGVLLVRAKHAEMRRRSEVEDASPYEMELWEQFLRSVAKGLNAYHAAKCATILLALHDEIAP